MLCSSDTSDTPKLHSDSNYFVFPFSTACSNMSSPHYLEEDRRRPMFLGQERSDPRYFVESCHSKGLYQVGNCVNDIPEDTPPETPKPSSGCVSVCILPREDLNLHPVNKQDKTLQQSGLMRRVCVRATNGRESCRLAPARQHVNGTRYHSDSISCSRCGLNWWKAFPPLFCVFMYLNIYLFRYHEAPQNNTCW